MNFKVLSVAILLIFGSTMTEAQKKIEYGIKAGFNLSKFMGPSEMDKLGAPIESQDLGFRIYVAAYSRYKLATNWWIGAEVGFSQKGGITTFEGTSFDKLQTDTTKTARRRTVMNTTLNYVDIPIMISTNIVHPKIELSFGPNIGILAGASGQGNTKYNIDKADNSFTVANQTINTEPVIGIVEYDLEYSHYTNKPGVNMGINGAQVSPTRTIDINGTQAFYESVLGAYSLPNQKLAREKGASNLYRPIDLGLNFGITFRATGSLRVGVKANISLLDITNDAMDFSQGGAAGNFWRMSVIRPDFDRNFTINAFVGFGF